jgi:hypothetical protein
MTAHTVSNELMSEQKLTTLVNLRELIKLKQLGYYLEGANLHVNILDPSLFKARDISPGGWSRERSPGIDQFLSCLFPTLR